MPIKIYYQTYSSPLQQGSEYLNGSNSNKKISNLSVIIVVNLPEGIAQISLAKYQAFVLFGKLSALNL